MNGSNDLITQSILSSINEGVTIYDADFRLVAWNDKYAEMGITPEPQIREGLHIEETYQHAASLGVFGSGDPKAIAKSRIDQVYAGTSPKTEDLFGSSGVIVEVRRSFIPGLGVAAVFSDVTRLRKRAFRQEPTHASITCGMCHDFNNLLQGIIAGLEAVSLETESKHIASAIQAASDGVELAKSYLDVASASISEEQASFDVIAAANMTATWLSHIVGKRTSVSFETSIPSLMVRANSGRFSAALTNLVLNADEAMPQGGAITISVIIRCGRLHVEVRDTGIGMDSTTIEMACTPYFSTKAKSRERTRTSGS